MPHQERIERRVFELIKKLYERGIIFCVASGRTYEELLGLFSEVSDLIYFMPLDGSLLLYRNEVLTQSPIKKEYVCRSLNMMKDSNVLFYAKDKTYFKWRDDDYKNFIINPHHHNIKKIKSLCDIDEDIYKVTFFNEHSYSFNYFKSYVKNNKIFDSLYEDDLWCDFTNKGISKGAAAKELLSRLSISPSCAAAFGDNTNDAELLKLCYNSYAMENGKNEIKRIARFTCKSVADEIERMV